MRYSLWQNLSEIWESLAQPTRLQPIPADISKTARNIVDCIFRCFVVRNPELYIRLYDSLVISRLLYCGSVWLIHKRKHIRMLQAAQSPSSDSTNSPALCSTRGNECATPIESTLSDQDTRTLGSLISLGLNHFFAIRKNSFRSQCYVLSVGLARADTIIANMFSRRICSKVSSRQIPSQIFLWLFCCYLRLTKLSFLSPRPLFEERWH